MRQAYTPACLIFFFGRLIRRSGSVARPMRKFSQSRMYAGFLFSLSLVCLGLPLEAQQEKAASPAATESQLSTEKALTLAQAGRCREAIPALKRAIGSQVQASTRKTAGIAGLRCSLDLNERDSALDFIRLLSKQFARDPEVLFILVHAYSDLSTGTAMELGRTAPQSIAAHKLNAEALEMQGNWDAAQLEYEGIIEKEPGIPGIHFLLGRLLLSRPDARDKSTERAKQEFQKELEIDPKNAGAVYVLGELARQGEDWDEAIARFSQAAKLDTTLAEAYLGWGSCLMAVKKYEEAIEPLRVAEKLTPGNPAVHFNLATALTRSGHQEAAEREFAIHRSLVATAPATPTDEKPR
jgi:tetratricopeptide (TPR) repeat protein